MKVTRKDLEAMANGETKTYNLPDARSCESGKVTAYQMQNILRCKFTCKVDFTTYTLTITKQP